MSWRAAWLKEVGSSQCPWGASPQQHQARSTCSKAVQARLIYGQLLPQMGRRKAGRGAEQEGYLHKPGVQSMSR